MSRTSNFKFMRELSHMSRILEAVIKVTVTLSETSRTGKIKLKNDLVRNLLSKRNFYH